MSKQSIRFGISDSSGKRAATWKCWTLTGKGKDDVYLACRELGGALKASLHQTGAWHIAFSEEFFENGFADKPDGRFIDKWPRPKEIAPGVTLAFRIITPYSAVNTPISSPNENITWIPAPPKNRAVEIAIIITSPHALVSSWPGKNSMNTKLVGSMPLDSGETVWVVHRDIDIPNLGTLHGTPRYFKGRSKDDLAKGGLHVLVFGDEKDGSRVILDSAVISDKN
jgi:hypothetical protein